MIIKCHSLKNDLLRKLILIPFLFLSGILGAQQDSVDAAALERMINLTEVVVRADLDVPSFIRRIKEDTTFYKAFRNLRILGFTSFNDIRMFNKKGGMSASLQSKTRQKISGGCRTMDVLEEKYTGDMYEGDDFRYFTAQLYASLFFTKGKICGENNVVKGIELSTKSKKGLDKHREQLKMMFFNPGKKIPGIPFIGNKINIFDPEVARYYDFTIDLGDYEGQYCYIFSIKAKPGLSKGDKNHIVFDNMTTWFNNKTMEIVGRQYDLSYSTPLYDFDVSMEVLMTRFQDLLVPKMISYNGNWDVAFKKREKGVFTATLFNFTR